MYIYNLVCIRKRSCNLGKDQIWSLIHRIQNDDVQVGIGSKITQLSIRTYEIKSCAWAWNCTHHNSTHVHVHYFKKETCLLAQSSELAVSYSDLVREMWILWSCKCFTWNCTNNHLNFHKWRRRVTVLCKYFPRRKKFTGFIAVWLINNTDEILYWHSLLLVYAAHIWVFASV